MESLLLTALHTSLRAEFGSVHLYAVLIVVCWNLIPV
jgi:hypothetical protein